MDMSVFNHHAWKHVQNVPFDINGTDRFEISCSAHQWPTKVKDGRFWQTCCSKNKSLNGFQHVSKCKGSLCCTNEKCPRKLADKPLNTKAFNRIVQAILLARSVVTSLKGNGVEPKEPWNMTIPTKF